MGNSDFQRNARIVGSALAVCERIYTGSMGTDDLEPTQTRIAQDPLDVLRDLSDVIQAARDRVLETMDVTP